MANALYAKGKEKMLAASINFGTDTIVAALVSSTYAQNLATDEFLNIATTLGTAQTLSGKTTSTGVFSANDVTFPAVAAGSTAKGVILYKDTGVASTSPLIAFIDTITGFPLTTNGGDITIQWDRGAYKIFSL